MDVYGAGLWDLMMIHREDVQMVVVHDNALVPRQCLSSLVMAVAGRVDCDDVDEAACNCSTLSKFEQMLLVKSCSSDISSLLYS